MNAGRYIRTIEKDFNYAAWNAGIISYFSGKKLINIDGLANDEVFRYIKNNKLMDYLKRKNVDYIIDYKEMIDNKSLRIRGGYDDERVFRCLKPLQQVDADSSSWCNSRLTMFKVNRNCL